MKMKNISNNTAVITLLTMCFCMQFILSCSSNRPSIPGLWDSPQLSRQIKLTFKPDDNSTLLTAKDVSELYRQALATGIDLGYEILSTDRKQGKLTFGKRGPDYPVRIEVLIEVIKNGQSAFVYISAFSKKQETADFAMSQFKDRYKLYF